MAKINVDLTTLSGWDDLDVGNHNITIKAKATGYVDSEPSEPVSVTINPTYSITYSLTNVTGDKSNPATIKGGSTTTLYFTAQSGYNLPDNVIVTGATGDFTRTSDTAGMLVISDPTDNVEVTVVGVLAYLTIICRTIISSTPQYSDAYVNLYYKLDNESTVNILSAAAGGTSKSWSIQVPVSKAKSITFSSNVYGFINYRIGDSQSWIGTTTYLTGSGTVIKPTSWTKTYEISSMLKTIYATAEIRSR